MMKITTIIDNALERELQSIVDDLKAKHIDLGQKASGKWTESLTVEVEGGHGVILAEDYTQYLTKGRANGKRPPIDPLEKWVNKKLGVNGKGARSVAFAIAIKISKEGTNIYKNGGTDLIDGVLTPNRVNKIKANIKQSVLFFVKEDLKRELIKDL